MRHTLFRLLFFFAIPFQQNAEAQRQMEALDRGLVAMRTGDKTVFLSWRLLGTDPEKISFNLYRSVGKGNSIKLNKVPISGPSSFVDSTAAGTGALHYSITEVINGKESATRYNAALPAASTAQQYHSIPLKTPEGYTPNDASVGDLDGDGAYEIVLHQTGRSRDNSQAGNTDPAIFQAYKLDGTLLWQINLGKNIREGAHYTQFMVYDLDGDGHAEVAMKTADGSIDGKEKVIGDSTKDWRNAQGKILDGPEYFTIFDGTTGAALATTDYIPSRYPTDGWGGVGGNGGTDNNGNRVDRFLACVAYLDGVHPSVIMCRGYYGRIVLAAWDWRNGKLSSRWVFDSKDGNNPFSGMGNHGLTVADVDGDGRDEIVYGSMVVDDDGKGLYTTGLRHGDALHVSDLDPAVPGMEAFGVHEIEEHTEGPGVALFQAKNGKLLFSGAPNTDVGRGVAENIDPDNKGAEMWWSGSNGLFNMKGEKIGPAPSSINFLVWWDGDLSRELLDRNYIDKYKAGRLLTAEGCAWNNGTKANPVLSADIWGDWREEVIFRSNDNKELRIFTTTIPTPHRLYTLMHDPQYRLSVAWQNVGYNQPPHTSFYMGEDGPRPPKPKIVLVKAKPTGAGCKKK